jgi:hypothetical protein
MITAAAVIIPVIAACQEQRWLRLEVRIFFSMNAWIGRLGRDGRYDHLSAARRATAEPRRRPAPPISTTFPASSADIAPSISPQVNPMLKWMVKPAGSIWDEKRDTKH